jgi:ABC-type nickel/cobalt efflux system permease component RcnA
MRRLAPLAWAVAAVGLMSAGPALAHPQGTKPVALIRALEPAGLEIVWVVALDDFEAVLRAQKVIGPGEDYDPKALPPEAAAGAVRSYLFDNVAVENDGAACGEELVGAGLGGPGVAVVFRFACPAALARIQITLTLLQDLSSDYVTIAQARGPAGVARGLFTSATPALRLDFTAGRPAVQPVATGTASPAGRTGRILGALQGAPGSVSLAVAVGLAFLLGALHALTPGHGKTMTAAYLVGAGGSMRQALTLGGIVSVTHAASVALLGGLAVLLDRLLLPSDWIPWTEVAAGVLMLGVGLTLLRPRAHDHDHGTPGEMPWRRLAVLGLVGGLIPSPEALGVLLVALSIGRWAAGMALVGAFSVGLAAVVLAVAVAAVRGGALARRLGHGRWSAVLPKLAAGVVLAVGALVTVRGALRV